MSITPDEMRSIAEECECEKCELLRCGADEVERLIEEGRKDYDGMRDFQRKFIDADHEARRLREALERITNSPSLSYIVENIARKALAGK